MSELHFHMRRKANDIIALFDLRNRAKLINQEPIRHSLYPQLPFSSSHKYHTSKEENRKMENPGERPNATIMASRI
jgi:hypothetical protein